jgi:hypothetical protein
MDVHGFKSLRGRSWALSILSALSLLTSMVVAVAVPPAGASNTPFPATGYFSIGQLNSHSFFVTPTGQPFYSSGIDHVTPDPDTDRTTGKCPYCEAIASEYPTTTTWVSATVSRLRSWGFNSLGPFSNYNLFGSKMPFSVQLGMASGDDWFTSSFVTHADDVAASEVAPLANDPNLIGWYTDSELHWGPGGTDLRPVLDTYLALPAGSPGHAMAEQYVGNPNGFVYALATRYFQVTTAAIRMYDTHHLILGVKATSQEIQPQLLEAASPYVDVFSIDDYALTPGLAKDIDEAFPQYLPLTPTLANLEKYVQRPIMVAEYSFRAATPQTPDTVPGLYATYPTQQARAAAYTNYIAPLYLHAPWVVGDEWFEYVDEPQGGRFDGENNNFGVVDVEDQPYQDLVTQMEILHSMAPDRVAQSGPACDSWANTTGQVTCTATLPPASFPLSVFSTLPGATQGAAYASYAVAEGGRPGYTFALPSNQSMPDGLQIDATGLVSGRPKEFGHFVVAVAVTDSTIPNPQSVTQTVSITIAPAPVAISTSVLPAGIVGVPYSAMLAATGGYPPYTWSGAGLPKGLSLSPTGEISGTPSASSEATVDITVTDSSTPNMETATRLFALTVRFTSMTGATVAPDTATWGGVVTYSATISGAGGVPTGTVTFTVGQTILCTAEVVSGEASCTATTAPLGDDSVTATYAGSSVYATSVDTAALTVLVPSTGYPVITSLSRSNGPTSGGTKVAITGSGFQTTKSVKFGATAASSFTVTSVNSIAAAAPAHAAGQIAVSVTTGVTSPMTIADLYTYTPVPPAVISISPASGAPEGGTVVTVNGTALTAATKVEFGTRAGTTISVKAGTQLTVKSPTGPSGASVNVRVTTAGGTSAIVSGDLFTYGPILEALSRTTGPVAGGTKVTITGNGFTTVEHVKFGSTTALSYTVKSTTQIVATAPVHSTGKIRVSVTTAAGTTPTTTDDLYTFR